ncbi:MAG: response regulator transcription factor [Anaerolineae bacterium]|nr:response regulator transcription factor [Anaerolineae bacterium]NUQ02895.1 response regulator transcription factor [Anaerolineae bacterium]
MAKPAHILIVDDESTVREVLRKYLERDGFHVSEIGDGLAALAFLREQRPDLVILDIMLPGADGFAITRALRGEEPPLVAEGEIPVILLTARTSELDRIAGFELGADDYVVKPFSPRELVARVKAVLRRSGITPEEEDAKPFAAAHLWIDPRAREIRIDGRMIMLTAKEYDLLLFLVRHARQVFSREQILNHVWGYEFYGDASTITVHIRRLREKIEPDPGEPRFIQTVWGVGYKFDPTP